VLIALLLLHAAVAVLAAAVGRRLGRAVFALAAVPSAAAVAFGLAAAPEVLAGGAVDQVVDWVPSIGLSLDALSLLMLGLVSGIGLLIFAYAAGYFDADRPDLGRYAGLLCAFSGAMLGLVTADDLLALFVFWELTSITSYLLIGLQHTLAAARAAALQALLVTGMGGLVLLAGLILLGETAGSYSMAAIAADPPQGPLVAAAALCILVGVATKSAQVPFHFWLAGAMAAPTPVSAYLHSATMVKAGVYLAARLAPALLVGTAGWQPVAMTLGAATMLLGGWRALRQHDLKLLLAYGTVSQLGFLIVLMSAGTEEALHAGIAVLLAHALFKGTLFMLVGAIDHAAGTRDLRRLSGVGRDLPVVAAIAGVAAASMAGVPLLFGFIAKEAALTALVEAEGMGAFAPAWLAAVVVGSALTVAYSARFLLGALGTKRGEDLATVHHRPSALVLVPPALLAALTLVLGVVPGLATGLASAATTAVLPDAHPDDLALWHGFGLPVVLTAVILAVGAGLVLARARVESLQGSMPTAPAAAAGYEGSLRGLLAVAARTTAVVQNGSLPIYLAVILAVAVVLPSAALLREPSAWWPERLADSPLQVVAVGVAILAALAAATAKRRFAAVLAMGAVGYAVVTLFALHGAPDLALTQLLIETLGLVVFVLALRHLPRHFPLHGWSLSQGLRALFAASVGVFVAGFAFVAGRARVPGPGVSEEFIARADEAGGHNIVNVILVDFRGFDTLGEITVLAVAALGVAALVLARATGARTAPPVGADDDLARLPAVAEGGAPR
jgi:multicomponent Na+:H+ antiporter subunit A